MRLNNLRSVGPTKSVIKAGLDFLDMNAQKLYHLIVIPIERMTKWISLIISIKN